MLILAVLLHIIHQLGTSDLLCSDFPIAGGQLLLCATAAAALLPPANAATTHQSSVRPFFSAVRVASWLDSLVAVVAIDVLPPRHTATAAGGGGAAPPNNNKTLMCHGVQVVPL